MAMVRGARFLEEMGRSKDFWITPENVEMYADRLAQYIAEFVRRTGTKGVVLGLSGGLDSAVVGALCALSGVNVRAVIMPYGSIMTNSGSDARAQEVAKKYKFAKTSVFFIDDALHCLRDGAPETAKERLASANLMAKIRTAKLYQYANLEDRLVVGTDVLPELMFGHFTKNGNGCDFRPCELILKREMYLLAKALDVPQSVIDATPDPELGLDKSDEDELGFTFEQGEDFLDIGTSGDDAVDQIIDRKIIASRHKRYLPPSFTG